MMWIGLLLGIVIGATQWGWRGAVVLGFLGWLGGVVVASRRSPAAPRSVVPPGPDRLGRLERSVARIEARLAQLEERIVVPSAAGASAEESAAIAQGAPVPEVAASVAPVAETVEPVAQGSPAPLAPIQPPPPPPTPTTPPRSPAQSNAAIAWLTGGNAIARVGLLILFIGFAFLLKYAADHAIFPVELRVALVAAGGIALLVVGWRLRERRRGYALGLQGAGVAVLYLTTFGALRLWHLIPPSAAFVLLALIAVFSAILAIRQDAMALAVIGAGGGFLAPVLTSTGEGNHVMLFSYYLLLNLGIGAIAFFRAWRVLNVVGFLFTFFIGLAWGMRSYQPDKFDTTEPFLVAFFLLYVAIAILYARKQAPSLKHFVDGTIVFGVPLAAFGLQAGLIHDVEFGLAFSSLAMAAMYVALSAYLRRQKSENFALLSEAFLALGIVFASAAIPLALDARWTSAAWALEGAAIVWIGVRQQRKLARAFGLLLELLAGLAYLKGYPRVTWVDDTTFLLEAPFVGALVLAAAGLWTHRLLLRSRQGITRLERGVVPFAFAWGLLWWLFAAHHEIFLHVPHEYTLNTHVMLLTATAEVLGLLALRWQWREAAWTTGLLLPLLALGAAVTVVGHSHPFANLGWFVWPIAIAVHFWILRNIESTDAARYRDWVHAGGMLVVAALGAQELHWVAGEYTSSFSAWTVASVVAVPALLVLLVSSRAADTRWPITERATAYRVGAAGVIAVGFIVWSVYANLSHDGRSDPLPYLPLLNALDLAHILAGLALVSAYLALRRTSAEEAMRRFKGLGILVGAVTFLWLNGILLRTLHHWADVPYNMAGIARSVLAQASLSVFWSVLALALMVFAARAARRGVWMAGATLMGVVVVKLFLVDLSRVTGIERIVSFIAVGVLMLVIGYFAPVPPRREQAQ
jgi:uncharacterized membrane protein